MENEKFEIIRKDFFLLADRLSRVTKSLEEATKVLKEITTSPPFTGLKTKSTDIEDRPWTTYGKERRRAQKGEAGWLKNPLFFDDIDDPLLTKLAERIKESEDGVVEGGYRYTFSGKEEQFIARKPVEKEEE